MGTEFFISATWSTIMVYVAALEDFFLHVERCWFLLHKYSGPVSGVLNRCSWRSSARSMTLQKRTDTRAFGILSCFLLYLKHSAKDWGACWRENPGVLQMAFVASVHGNCVNRRQVSVVKGKAQCAV
jgi:hypothetical protein